MDEIWPIVLAGLGWTLVLFGLWWNFLLTILCKEACVDYSLQRTFWLGNLCKDCWLFVERKLWVDFVAIYLNIFFL